MGQYYLGYVKHNEKNIKVFDNKVDGDWTGLKLMEHSYWLNSYVGNVVNDLFYNKGKVCWVGDYFDENDYKQINCEDKGTVKAIGENVWDKNKGIKQTKCSRSKVRYLTNCLLVNHTKRIFVDCDNYYEHNKVLETWENDDEYEEWWECVHLLPLLTCSANHSGGSYYGLNMEDCGTWFNDTIEVVLKWELQKLLNKGYRKVEYLFKE